MVRTAINRLLCALLPAVLAGCHDGRLSSDSNVVTDSVSMDTTVALVPGAAHPCARLSLHLTFVKPAHATAEARQAARRINASVLAGMLLPEYADTAEAREAAALSTAAGMSLFVHRYAERYAAAYRDDCLDLYRDDAEHAAFYERTYRVQTQMQQGRDPAVCYTARVTYANGTDCLNALLARNYHMRTGQTVSLDDVLRPGYERPLAQMACGYVPADYILGKHTITLIYNHEWPGTSSVTLTDRQLEPLLRKQK